jgi:hypothetical protein
MILLYVLLISLGMTETKLDLDSYCRGFCSNRYQTGFYDQDKRQCLCGDYYPVNLENRLNIPNRPEKKSDPIIIKNEEPVSWF